MTKKNSISGRKFDNLKLRWDLLPFAEIEQVIEVLTYGADKYDDNNWQFVPNAKDRYFAAAMRHLIRWRRGKLIDGESSLPHLAHAICSLLFLMWFDNQNELNVDTSAISK